MKENKQVDSYIKASLDASSRSRNVVYILVMASVFFFIAYWNSRQSGWFIERYKSVKEVYELCVQGADSSLQCNTNQNNIDTARVHKFLKEYEVSTRGELEDIKKIFDNLRQDVYSVKVPVFGIYFDINDLGLFAGITLSILLIIFLFCLESEESNLKITFSAAEKTDALPFYYTYLAMGQVLTIPPKLEKTLIFPWRILEYLLYVLPFATQVTIFTHDLVTSGIGNVFNKDAVDVSLILSGISLIVISILTFCTVRLAVKIDILWKDYRNKIIKP